MTSARFTTGQSAEVLAYLAQSGIASRIQSSHNLHGDATIVVAAADLIPCMEAVRDDARLHLDVLIDLTAVDYLPRNPRFEVVYHLLNFDTSCRLRIKVPLNEGETVPSLFHHYLSANWMEREVWDLYGIAFSGHPDLRRILLYPEFQGHPLRKDYAKDAQQPRLPLRDHRPWKQPPPEGVS